MKPRMLLVNARWSHLGGHSGFAPLARELAEYFDVRTVRPSLADKVMVAGRLAFSRCKDMLTGRAKRISWSPFYTRNGLLLETAARRMLSSGRRYDVVFFEALEDHFDAFQNARRWLPPTTVIAGVSHQPPAWWKVAGMGRNVYAAVDTLIGLSNEAVGFLRTELGHPNVSFVPHGVDVSFFSHKASQQKSIDPGTPINVLFCGQWLRDFDLLLATLDSLQADGSSNILFHLVVPTFARNTSAHYKIAQHANVRWYAGLSDDDLLRLYRSCHMMFLPLIDATANNSVLEAMATGLPLVVARVGGIPDYVQDDEATFFSARDATDATEKLVWATRNYVQCCETAGRAAVRARRQLSWSKVALNIRDVVSDKAQCDQRLMHQQNT